MTKEEYKLYFRCNVINYEQIEYIIKRIKESREEEEKNIASGFCKASLENNEWTQFNRETGERIIMKGFNELVDIAYCIIKGKKKTFSATIMSYDNKLEEFECLLSKYNMLQSNHE